MLYDGVCGFCHGSVRWLIDRDPDGQFVFAALQGETAADLRVRHPQLPTDIDTMVYVVVANGSEQVYLRTEAILRVGSQLGGGWSALSWLLWVPAPLRDIFYRAFVRVRYRIFGKVDACTLPSPAERERFLA